MKFSTSLIIPLLAMVVSYFVYCSSSPYYGKEIDYLQQHINMDQKQENDSKNFTDFHNNLGIKFLNIRQIDAARDEFNKALKEDSLNKNSTIHVSECDIFKNSSSSASDSDIEITNLSLIELKKAMPEDPTVYMYLGDFNLIHHKLNTALDYYSKSLNLSHNSIAGAYEGKGLVYDDQNNLPLAYEMFKKASELSEWNAGYYGSLAGICYELKKYNESINKSQLACELNPNLLDQYISYSNSYRCIGKLEDALDIQKQQISIMEKNDPITSSLNQIVTSFRSSPSHIVRLGPNYNQAEYYYYNIALTSFLLDKVKTREYREYVDKANNLDIDLKVKSDVQQILNYDIENLQKAQPKDIELRTKTNEFRKEYLTLI
jgi:tetratricopeptide (TPR) repeat protein